MHKLGVRKVYFFGIILTAVCALAFGTLDFIADKGWFLVSFHRFSGYFFGLDEADHAGLILRVAVARGGGGGGVMVGRVLDVVAPVSGQCRNDLCRHRGQF